MRRYIYNAILRRYSQVSSKRMQINQTKTALLRPTCEPLDNDETGASVLLQLFLLVRNLCDAALVSLNRRLVLVQLLAVVLDFSVQIVL